MRSADHCLDAVLGLVNGLVAVGVDDGFEVRDVIDVQEAATADDGKGAADGERRDKGAVIEPGSVGVR